MEQPVKELPQPGTLQLNTFRSEECLRLSLYGLDSPAAVILGVGFGNVDERHLGVPFIALSRSAIFGEQAAEVGVAQPFNQLLAAQYVVAVTFGHLIRSSPVTGNPSGNGEEAADLHVERACQAFGAAQVSGVEGAHDLGETKHPSEVRRDASAVRPSSPAQLEV
jgi:hypothetical protein